LLFGLRFGGSLGAFRGKAFGPGFGVFV